MSCNVRVLAQHPRILLFVRLPRSDPIHMKSPRVTTLPQTSIAKTTSPTRVTSAAKRDDDDDDDGLSYSSTEHDVSGAHEVGNAGATRASLKSAVQQTPSGELISCVIVCGSCNTRLSYCSWSIGSICAAGLSCVCCHPDKTRFMQSDLPATNMIKS